MYLRSPCIDSERGLGISEWGLPRRGDSGGGVSQPISDTGDPFFTYGVASRIYLTGTQKCENMWVSEPSMHSHTSYNIVKGHFLLLNRFVYSSHSYETSNIVTQCKDSRVDYVHPALMTECFQMKLISEDNIYINAFGWQAIHSSLLMLYIFNQYVFFLGKPTQTIWTTKTMPDPSSLCK